jgi:glycine/D-amino acid oxidase-like deaminating enzyme/nitrite reductase/ring-hydroxylating ferredoxin subunit
MHSIWMLGQGLQPQYAPLPAGTLEVDTVVVGGGITGVTTAMLLGETGQTVALLEADRIGAGNTGGSTGNLYGTVSQGLSAVRSKWNADVARDVVVARLQAVDLIERTVSRFAIECGFARRPLHRCVAGDDPEQLQSLEEEFAANAEAGLAPAWVDVPDLPFALKRALRIENQAQFNPYLYTQGLARALAARGVHVFESSPVVDFDAGEGLATTAAGSVRAKQIVLATHTPKGFNLVQAEMEVYREYGMSAQLGATSRRPQGIFWVRDEDRSIRTCHAGSRDHLVIVGEHHKTGEGEPGVDYHDRLARYAAANFDGAVPECRWSAQQYRSADMLPYIGRSAHENVFIATGFAADGLTWGTVAARIIAELVLRQESRITELLAPRRFTPIKSAKGWASENAAVVRHLIGDRLGRAELERFAEVDAGEGRLVDVDGRKYAVHRSSTGNLSVLSPVCPHLKCHVRWNAGADSWDCPCHGSRFATDGRVLEGPALHPLERFEVD